MACSIKIFYQSYLLLMKLMSHEQMTIKVVIINPGIERVNPSIAVTHWGVFKT